jgi:recombination protein RecR
MELLQSHHFDEVILATNWTINGEATAVFIKKIINQLSKANVYRLALGLPINSALDYADNMTLKYAIENKTKY